MKRRCITIFLIVTLISMGCDLTTISLPKLSAPTFTPTASQTPTETPSPTPSPTPLPAAQNNQGEMDLFVGNYDQALHDFQTAMSSTQDSETQAEAMLGIGRVDYLTGNWQGAVQVLNSLVQTYQETQARIKAYYFLGQSYTQLNNPKLAAEDYGHYLSLQPGVLDAYVEELLGDALLSDGDPDNAITAYQAAIKAPRLSDTTSVQIKVGQAYAWKKDYNNAIRTYMSIYQNSTSDYDKAEMDFLTGQIYLDINQPQQAYARFQDAVTNYPKSYDSYSGLVELVKDGIQVDDLSRGLVDYYAHQYANAVDALNRYVKDTPKHDGTPHYYMALSLEAMGKYDSAILQLDELIQQYKGDRFWATAFDEKASIQWSDLNQYDQAAQTLLGFVSGSPTAAEAPTYLFEAGRIQEMNNKLTDAATTWERLINEYPSADDSYQALFLAGVTRFRLKNYDQCLTIFQRSLLLATNPGDQAAAYLWIGKTQQAQNNTNAARSSWDQAAQRDPTGYYSERAKQLLNGTQPFSPDQNYDLGYDLSAERPDAETWLRTKFSIPASTDLDSLGSLANDPRMIRANAYWQLGLYQEAETALADLTNEIKTDPASNFRILPHLLDLGMYRLAITVSRQILTLANMDDASSMTAPIYFNHIRFGTYYRDLVASAAQTDNFHPLFLFSVIRQESLFEGFIDSSAGAVGAMQIMPDTGKQIANQLGWPTGYTSDDLYRPMVNIRLGATYLARQRDYFNNDIYAALAAYNGGPGNTQTWEKLAPNDPDLFLELIRFPETRQYIMQIFEFEQIYQQIYQRQQ
ncbi:MAG: tetratricopeptide repeat protein [Anaerolineaceae bacterium]|nr:tetratricopeptide repeat protein [Anaerolineaceae bacterium]